MSPEYVELRLRNRKLLAKHKDLKENVSSLLDMCSTAEAFTILMTNEWSQRPMSDEHRKHIREIGFGLGNELIRVRKRLKL